MAAPVVWMRYPGWMELQKAEFSVSFPNCRQPDTRYPCAYPASPLMAVLLPSTSGFAIVSRCHAGRSLGAYHLLHGGWAGRVSNATVLCGHSGRLYSDDLDRRYVSDHRGACEC